MLDPAKARFHGDMLFLIRLEQLGIRTPLWSHRGGQDGPPVRVLGGDQGLWVHDEAITDRNLGCFGLRWTASTRPFLRDTDRFDLRVEAMVTPGPWRAPTPPLAGVRGRCAVPRRFDPCFASPNCSAAPCAAQP